MAQDAQQAFAFTVTDKSKAPTPVSGDSPFPIVDTIKGAWPTASSTSSSSSSSSKSNSTKKASEWFTSLEGFSSVTSGYGPRNIGNGDEFHNGIDVGAADNAKVRTPTAGTIESSIPTAQSGGYGNMVVLKDENGMYHWFCHMNKANVKQGDSVKANDIIGFAGSTGQSTGTHLHYTISSNSNGNHNNPGGDIDPDSYSYTKGLTDSKSGKGKSNISTASSGIKKAIHGLGKLTYKQALELDTTATEPAGSESLTPYSSLDQKDKKLFNEYDKLPGHKNYNPSSFKHINVAGQGVGGGTGFDYSELLTAVVNLLTQINSNTSELANLTTIVDLLSQQFDIAVSSANSTAEQQEKVSKLNKIKNKLKEIQGKQATANQGSSTGFGNSLMNQDMDYLMTAMSAIATT
jgi:hypothetical protein